MAKKKPELWRDASGAQWVVYRCSGTSFYCDSYDEALAEFLRQVELYRQPERKRLLGWTCFGLVRMRPEGDEPLGDEGWQRAPWLDEPSEEGEI